MDIVLAISVVILVLVSVFALGVRLGFNSALNWSARATVASMRRAGFPDFVTEAIMTGKAGDGAWTCEACSKPERAN